MRTTFVIGNLAGRAGENRNLSRDASVLERTDNPIFTWVRLAQRIPVRVCLDQVPPGWSWRPDDRHGADQSKRN